MNIRTIGLLVFALVAAVVTAYFTRGWLNAQRAPAVAVAAAAQTDPLPHVLVAKHNLPAGLMLEPSDMRWQAWPDESLASSYVIKGEASPEDFAGSVVRKGIAPGQPVTEERVVKAGERGFLAAMLESDMRAVSVPVNAASGIAGLIFPGDRVDVILTHTFSRRDGDEGLARRASETVLKNIRILAVDQRTDHPEDKPALAKTATLEVTAKQAEMISMATEIGRVSLSLRSLRNAGGETQSAAESPSFTLDNELSAVLNPPTIVTQKSQRSVHVVRGSESHVLTFSKSGVSATPSAAE